ncbi:hypothetical protein [Enterococcus lemanii]|jgi:hypothetical protein|uniref:Uncharacterized protein n=1 Tax=Enterococcus lemanii TaxID=1159752 RepID=A0ABV9MX20_9ENTE|nr:hypothetical protein [Enterococcus lemanii]MBM7710090.1 hypothetical protein [Enterococcus lemanii]NLM66218.1 hypothetical protein [Enterococcus sp.]
MKTSTKVTVGLSLTAIAGIATTVIVSDLVINKVLQLSNRRKVKNFVKVKFKGNDTLLDLIDHLDDKEIAAIIRAGKKLNDSREKVAHYGENIKDATLSTKDKVLEMLDAYL